MCYNMMKYEMHIRIWAFWNEENAIPVLRYFCGFLLLLALFRQRYSVRVRVTTDFVIFRVRVTTDFVRSRVRVATDFCYI